MDVNFEIMKNAFPLLIAGAGITIEITALSVFFGMLIGVVVSLVRLSDFKILRWLGNVDIPCLFCPAQYYWSSGRCIFRCYLRMFY